MNKLDFKKVVRIFRSYLLDQDEEKGNKLTNLLYIIQILLFGLIYSFMSLNNHRLFETFGWDLAVFNQGVWQWSKFRIPYSSFHDLPWLADHFHLILVTLAPLYWIFPTAKTLLVTQAWLTVAGAIPIYLLSRKVISYKPFSLVLSFAYLTFYSLQWHTFSGFHELAFLPLTLGFTLYFWHTKNTRNYWISLLLTLLVKEEIGFLLAAIGIWEIFDDRKRYKQALLTIALSILYSLFLVSFLMPRLAGGNYRHSGFGKYGNTIIEVATSVAKNPLIIPSSFIDSPVKVNTMLVTFWPWLFLPIFSPTTIIPIIEQLASRFLDYEKIIRWTPYFAYSLPMATLMAWGSIYGTRNIFRLLKKFKLEKRKVAIILSLILFITILLEDIVLHAPINSLFKKAYYRTEEWMINNNKVINCVPEKVSISAQNNLAPHLSPREHIKVFPEGLRSNYDYIIVDLHKGQSENSFHFLGSEKTNIIIDDLLENDFYNIVCRSGDAMLLERKVSLEDKLNYPFLIEIKEK